MSDMKDTVTYPLSAIMGEEENRIEHLERELAEAKRNYMDLIMSVGKAYPNETRHQTALRYIRECETPSTDQAKCSAIKEGK